MAITSFAPFVAQPDLYEALMTSGLESAPPMDATYRNWMANFMRTADPTGYTNPYIGSVMRQQQPFAAMQYQTAPAVRAGYSPTRSGFNPYAEFLTGMRDGGESQFARIGMAPGYRGYNPLSSRGWMQRAMDVEAMLGQALPVRGADDPIGPIGTIQERFGPASTEEGEATILARHQALAEAPIMTATPSALQRETGAILQRLYDQWALQPRTAATPSYLAGAPGLWNMFGLDVPVSGAGQQPAVPPYRGHY